MFFLVYASLGQKDVKRKNVVLYSYLENNGQFPDQVKFSTRVNEGEVYFRGTPQEAVSDEKIKKFYLGTEFTI